MSGPVQSTALHPQDPSSLAAAIVWLSQQIFEYPNATDKAAFVAQTVPPAVGATAAAVFIRITGKWSAYYSPAPPNAASIPAPPLDQPWTDATGSAVSGGDVPTALAAALGAPPAQCAVLPLRAGRAVYGALVLAFVGGIPDGTLEVAQLLARQLADACEQQERLAAERRLQELEGLREMSGLARVGMPPAEFAGVLAERIARLLRADSCVVTQWDETAGAFRPLAGFGRVQQATPVGSTLPEETNRLTVQVLDVHPVLIHSSSPDPAARRLAEIVEERLGFRTALGVRLVADSRTVGALVALRRDPDALFDDADSRLLEIIAAQAAQEVRSFQEGREQQARMKSLQGLWELAQLARRAASSRAFYDDLTAHVARMLDSDACFLLRYEPETQVLRPAAAFGMEPGQPPTAREFYVGPGSAFEASLSAQATQVHADAADPRLRAIAEGNRALGFSVSLNIGLVADGKTVGSLAVARRDPSREYAPDEMRVIEIIAQPLAQEIESYRLRQELRRVLEVRDAILKHLPDSIVVYNQQGRVVYANPSAARGSADIIAEGKHLDEVKAGFRSYDITGGPIDGDVWLLEKTLSEGLTVLHEQYPVSRPGRPTQYIDFSSVPIRDAGGQITGAAIMYRDVTEQVESEARGEGLLIELEASESRFRSIVNHIDSALMVRDRETVLYTNEQYRELFGLEQDVVGMTIPELVDLVAPCFADSDEYRLRLIPTDDLSITPYRLMFELISPRHRFVERLSSPVRGGNGEVFGRVVEYRDLTREHLMVEQRDEFLARTAFVLRGGLGLPTGELLRLLRQLDALKASLETGGATTERIAEVEGGLRQVNREIASVLEMIGRLRDLPRALEGRLDVTPEPHDLAAAVAAALDGSVDLAPARVLRSGPDQGPLKVLGHPQRVEQVIRWLLENAAIYSPPSSPVEVRLRRVQPGMAQLCISDHGLGLGPDEAAQMFSCYYRSPRAQDRWPRGLGISLYLARAIIERLGGALRAESSGAGQGTSFVLELRLAPTNA